MVWIPTDLSDIQKTNAQDVCVINPDVGQMLLDVAGRQMPRAVGADRSSRHRVLPSGAIGAGRGGFRLHVLAGAGKYKAVITEPTLTCGGTNCISGCTQSSGSTISDCAGNYANNGGSWPRRWALRFEFRFRLSTQSLATTM